MSAAPARCCLVLPVLVLTLAACGSDGGDRAVAASPQASSAATTSAAGASSSPSPGAAPPSEPGPAADRTFTIAFADGAATGDTGRLKVKVGDTVALRVTSTKPDEVHLHGYDKSVPVGGPSSALLVFTADIPGVFSLELEQAGFELAKLQVQ